MLSNHSNNTESDPFATYARSLHDYTLRLWTDSIRDAEEKARSPSQSKDVAEMRQGGQQRKGGEGSK